MRLLLCAAFAAILGSAQQTPDFNGSWTMDAKRSESAHQDVPTGPSTLTIRQSPGAVSIETTRREQGELNAFHETLVFTTDGKENVASGDGGAKVTTKAHWNGTDLVTETARNLQDSTVTTMYVYSLLGKDLVVDKSLTVQHGYQFRGAATTGKGRDVYVKSR